MDGPHSSNDVTSTTTPNLIPTPCDTILPQMLTLLELNSGEIERITAAVPQGARNIQDIYPLTPLQEGMLFQHIIEEQRDAYVVLTLLKCQSNPQLQALIAALQQVIGRHDVLRSSIFWKGLSQPVQVIQRSAPLPVEVLPLETSEDAVEQMRGRLRPELHQLDLGCAPLMRLQIAEDPKNAGDWYVLLVQHHLICDALSMEIFASEVNAFLRGRGHELPVPIQFRLHVAQTRAHARTSKAEEFFRKKLADFTEPSPPFGLTRDRDPHRGVEEKSAPLDAALIQRIRAQAQRRRVTVAALFHAACALVVAHTSQKDDVVFGTVLLGRLRWGGTTQCRVGMFINTLPLRLRLANITVSDWVSQTHRELLSLLSHEQVELSIARRCSGLAGSEPLFSMLLNYRYDARKTDNGWNNADAGISALATRAWTNYPITVIAEDNGEQFSLTAQTIPSIDPLRIINYVSAALRVLIEALDDTPERPALSLSILTETELRQVLYDFNALGRDRWPSSANLQTLPPHQRIYILDSLLKPVPIGATGRVYIAGPGVTEWRYGQQRAPTAPLLIDPFSTAEQTHMYDSGLRGRWSVSGDLELAEAPTDSACTAFKPSSAQFAVPGTAQFEAPQGATEQTLARIWEEVLKVTRIGRNDSFFALGGHSVIGIKLLLKVSEQLNVRAAAISIFRCPTVRQMAEMVDSLQPESGLPIATSAAEMDEGFV